MIVEIFKNVQTTYNQIFYITSEKQTVYLTKSLAMYTWNVVIYYDVTIIDQFINILFK